MDASDSLGPLIIDLDGGLSLSGTDRQRLRSPLVGGVILFKRNFKDCTQLRALTREIKALRTPALLITVDQEGGRVQRFQGKFSRLPPAAVCGRLYDSQPGNGRQLARDTALVMASELIDCGVDLSFAPVLDVLSCDSRVIGDRAFHSDPETVQVLAGSYLAGMHDAGMGAVGKHFPGHGGVGADSHHCLPEDRRSMDELRRCDVRPYLSLGGQLQGVMLAHVLYGAIDPRIPSYSSFWIHEVLREEVGFGGVVFSDDLSMAGAGDQALSARCREALRAGCDLLPVCNDLPAVDQVLKEAADEAGWDTHGRKDVIASLYARPAPPDPERVAAARERVRRSVPEAD